MVNGQITKNIHPEEGGFLLIIPARGPSWREEFHGKEPSDEQIRKHINGGWLEQVPALVRHGTQLCQAFVDEEGLLKDLPFNETASRLVRGAHKIVGTMIVVVPFAQEKGG